MEQSDGYYTQVSEEIGLIVQGSESQGSRARGCGEPPQPAGTDAVGECCSIVGTYRKHMCTRLVPMQNLHGTQTLLQSSPRDLRDLNSHMKTLGEIISIRA